MVIRSPSKAAVAHDGIVARGPQLTSESGTADLASRQGAEAVPELPTTSHEGEASSSPEAGLAPDLQAVIGQQLRMLYHEVLNEPIPDRFVRLLDELAQKEGSGS